MDFSFSSALTTWWPSASSAAGHHVWIPEGWGECLPGHKKLGGKSRLLYPAGGLTGKRLQDLLEEEGLDHRPLPIDGMVRESLVILEESTGRQYRFGMPGPKLRKKEWEQFLEELSVMAPPPDDVVASGGLQQGRTRKCGIREAKVAIGSPSGCMKASLP